jgi:hypothetical protein
MKVPRQRDETGGRHIENQHNDAPLTIVHQTTFDHYI